MEPVTVGLIGAGRLGARHAHTLATRVPGGRLAVVADADGERARAVTDDLPGVDWSDDPAAVLGDRSIAAVVIVTPTATHADLIAAAAAAGKDIFCEKPIALDLPATDRALAAVRAAGVRLQIGFQRRFDPDFARVRELVRSGALGRPALLRATLRDPRPPTPGYLATSGGIFVDMGIHDFDAARFVLGSEVVEVYASGTVVTGEPFTSLGDADTAVACLRFASGALGVIDLSRQSVYGYDVRLEVLGTAATARIEEAPAGHLSRLSAEGVARDYIADFLERFAAAYAAELEHFVAGVASRAEPGCTGEDGRQALAIALAATEAWRTGRPVAVAAGT